MSKKYVINGRKAVDRNLQDIKTCNFSGGNWMSHQKLIYLNYKQDLKVSKER